MIVSLPIKSHSGSPAAQNRGLSVFRPGAPTDGDICRLKAFD
ncbi:MAG TPA: hypothetical protein VFR47_11705 [Anaerolineales bacterium]|nr:hypothetical protein [Anaerolineales bacterium]